MKMLRLPVPPRRSSRCRADVPPKGIGVKLQHVVQLVLVWIISPLGLPLPAVIRLGLVADLIAESTPPTPPRALPGTPEPCFCQGKPVVECPAEDNLPVQMHGE